MSLSSSMPLPSSAAGTNPPQRSFWISVICGAAILTIGIGARQSFGIFQRPIAADLHVGRELWSFANALSMLLMGAFSPFAGNLADRFGTARTVAALQALDTPFAAVDVLPDPRIRQELSAISNWPTVPQLFANGELIGGCDIVTEMYESGELAQALL